MPCILSHFPFCSLVYPVLCSQQSLASVLGHTLKNSQVGASGACNFPLAALRQVGASAEPQLPGAEPAACCHGALLTGGAGNSKTTTKTKNHPWLFVLRSACLEVKQPHPDTTAQTRANGFLGWNWDVLGVEVPSAGLDACPASCWSGLC